MNDEIKRGNYVTDERIAKIDDVLWNDETVQFIAKTTSKVKAKYQDTSEKFDHTKGWPRMVVTDQRVFIKIPKVFNTKTESIDYDNLSAATLGSSGLSGTQIKLRTIQGKTYVFKADDPGETELEQMVEYIREHITTQQPQESETTSSPTGSSPTSKADAHKADSCVECGQAVSGSVKRCPHCGFNPSSHRKWRWLHSACAATLVLAPVCLPKARAHGKKERGGVTGK